MTVRDVCCTWSKAVGLIWSAPLRIVFPALEDEAWRIITGADATNAPWHYHNGGWWPCLLWKPRRVASTETDGPNTTTG